MSEDVIVIGGGPAGLSAGIALAQHGASVTIYEQADEPGQKPCGEGLLPRALEELSRLGLSQSALLAQGQPLLGVRYFSVHGRSAAARFAEGLGLGLRRSSLQSLLRSLAVSTPGVRLRHAEARVVRDSRDVCRVQSDGEVMTPRLVVAADGLHSRARKAAHLACHRPPPYRYGARQHFEIEPWTNHVEVYFGRGTEAYVTPTSYNEVNVAVLWRGERTSAPASKRRPAPELLQAFPALARRLASARSLGDIRGAGPLGVNVPRPACNGLVLVGDAAGYVDAITGEGVGLAIAKARLLGRTLAQELRRPGPQLTFRQLKPYLSAARQLERHHVMLTKLVLLATRSPWLVERTVEALAADGSLFRHFLTANQGGSSPFAMPLGSMLGLLESWAGRPAQRSARS